MGTLTKNRDHGRLGLQTIARIVIISITILSTSVYAQKVAPEVSFASGYSFAEGDVYIDMSFGEFAITTISSSDQIITQGFLQPFKIELPCATPDLVYYPNPVVKSLTIEALDCEVDLAYVEVFDLLGTTVLTAAPTNNLVDLSSIGVGVYIIRTFNSSMQFLGSIKIVKVSA